MINIIFHGALKKLTEKGELLIQASSPIDAVRLLMGVLPGFRKEYDKHPYFFVVEGREGRVTDRDVRLSFGSARSMHIYPDVAGAKVGGGAPSISPEATAYEDREDETLSALFNGGINTSEQGVCIPVIYGRVRRAGSAVINAGISVEKIPLEEQDESTESWSEDYLSEL